mmetsp:Transcript_64551/g.173545  ORF Transcript_64551/g.173545 Transcript_64551/m.173545 type:complete len:326 (-) Transcript_64551:605-1582(-)
MEPVPGPGRRSVMQGRSVEQGQVLPKACGGAPRPPPVQRITGGKRFGAPVRSASTACGLRGRPPRAAGRERSRWSRLGESDAMEGGAGQTRGGTPPWADGENCAPGGAKDTNKVKRQTCAPHLSMKVFLQPADCKANRTEAPRSPDKLAWCRPRLVCIPILQGAQWYSFRTEAEACTQRCATALSFVPASPPMKACCSEAKPVEIIWASCALAVLSSSGAASAKVLAPCSMSKPRASSEREAAQSRTVFMSALAWFTSALAASSRSKRPRCATPSCRFGLLAGSAPAAAKSGVWPWRTKLFTSARNSSKAAAASTHESGCSLARR